MLVPILRERSSYLASLVRGWCQASPLLSFLLGLEQALRNVLFPLCWQEPLFGTSQQAFLRLQTAYGGPEQSPVSLSTAGLSAAASPLHLLTLHLLVMSTHRPRHPLGADTSVRTASPGQCSKHSSHLPAIAPQAGTAYHSAPGVTTPC